MPGLWRRGFGLFVAGALAMGVLSVRADVPYEQVLAFGMGDWLCTQPQGALVETEDGYLYGTTQSGGRPHLGTVFRMSLNGTEFKILHHFGPALTRDGLYPRSGLTLGDDQYLYGTTEQGGEFNFGTVYRIKVHPRLLYAGLVVGPDGALYGTSSGGGEESGGGTVYRFDVGSQMLSLVHSFTSGTLGHRSSSELLLRDDGYFYGTLEGGGAGQWVIYRMRPDGADYQALHRFRSTREEGSPSYPALTEGPDGYVLHPGGSFEYAAAQDFNCVDTFEYYVNDGRDNSPTVTVTIEILPVNDPPSFVKGPDVSVLEDAGPQTLAGWATELSAGDPSLFSQQPVISPDGTQTFTTAPDRNGSTVVTVLLRDDGGTEHAGQDTSAAQTFVITVQPALGPPLLRIEVSLDGLCTITWEAIPGCIYRVQYKDALDDPEWTDLPDAVVAEGNSCSFTDWTADPLSHRFYRIYQETSEP